MKKIIRNFIVPAICILSSSSALSEPSTVNSVPPVSSELSAQPLTGQADQNSVTMEKISITSAWARRSMSGSSNSVAYISIHNSNSQDVEIIGVTAMDIANRVELHTTFNDTQGVSRMVALDKLVIPAGGDVVMASGGIHIMLLDLKKALNIGEKIKLDLKFKDLGPREVEVEIKNL